MQKSVLHRKIEERTWCYGFTDLGSNTTDKYKLHHVGTMYLIPSHNHALLLVHLNQWRPHSGVVDVSGLAYRL